MLCPTCRGTKSLTLDHVTLADGSSRYGVEVPCYCCGGEGVVPDEMSQWIEDGRRLRAGRVAAGRTLREEAARLGVKPSQLAAMETGRVKPEFTEPTKGATT